MTNQLAENKPNNLVTKVADRIQEMCNGGQINMPPMYSATNALQAAYFTLTAVDFGKSKTLLDQATPDSVAFALQDMAIQGLSVAKKQGYFIVYGDKLQFQRSYHGTQAVLRRMNGIKDVWANVIWKGEEFNVIYNERGVLSFDSHTANWKAATGKKEDIEGAYCIVEYDDGSQFLTVMTMPEILTAWSTSKNKSVQDKYPQEMAKRTVINRASKRVLNTSDDQDVLIESISRTMEDEHDNRKDMGEIQEVQREIEQNANNGEFVDFSPVDNQVILDTNEAIQEDVAFDNPKFKAAVEADPF